MSTWLYLVCLDHNPPLEAEAESGQHLTDLPGIRADIANRDVLVRIWESGDPAYYPHGHFEGNTLRFLAAHPSCNIGIRDEYGADHAAVTE